MQTNERRNLKNWARSCHFDWFIAVKEDKGKKWMNIISWLEFKFDFDLDDFKMDEGWQKILDCLNKISDKEVDILNGKRYW